MGFRPLLQVIRIEFLGVSSMLNLLAILRLSIGLKRPLEFLKLCLQCCSKLTYFIKLECWLVDGYKVVINLLNFLEYFSLLQRYSLLREVYHYKIFFLLELSTTITCGLDSNSCAPAANNSKVLLCFFHSILK